MEHPETPHGHRFHFELEEWLMCEECDIAWPAGSDLYEVTPGYFESSYWSEP